ncbi:PREDICTED: very-long-chain 3-oxoacyl-CoA reductase-like isoform X6 [Amphimedon queenslandica]|uniref:Uncharacterized protein n=1 Tax=Amphimedon queenslandica TaxID=400682 RepID=A0AAN0JML7_AMPQE|nr:PREDICTED: very-long-chain 3-oxoacyl-CoA reductase-like isoform X5 [Amphimedon queenslandica]XP_019858243.1 PREDICTED: very-long-chain 3-oxoacyl-CoA reductase-like isoform X6 [Amphimedon queenslandica]|eukprot:XP_019858238.1 PREDICTED: very-long-chain 3-oxoacyl-CoA reductase-like isoform X5 [Amphimedon queenslandica]
MEYWNQAADVFMSDRFCLYRNIAAVIGTAYVLRFLLKKLWALSGGFCAYFLAPWGISRINIKKYGSWAVVTGASEGIGRGYALELARQGLNVAIMSRSREKLEKVEEEIRSKYNRDVRVIPVDFSEGQSVYDDIQAEISDLDIAILVNNVGTGIGGESYFSQVDPLRHRKVIELNCQSMIQMTHLVLPKMLEKKKGIIVNIASILCLFPVPLSTVYSSSKIFVLHFSTALQTEYKSKGIIVQCNSPGYVATQLVGLKKATWWAVDPVAYGRSSVATIGLQHHTNGCLTHVFQKKMVEMLLGQKTAIPMLNIRRKYFLKRQSEKQKKEH